MNGLRHTQIYYPCPVQDHVPTHIPHMGPRWRIDRPHSVYDYTNPQSTIYLLMVISEVMQMNTDIILASSQLHMLIAIS